MEYIANCVSVWLHGLSVLFNRIILQRMQIFAVIDSKVNYGSHLRETMTVIEQSVPVWKFDYWREKPPKCTSTERGREMLVSVIQKAT